MVFNPVVSGAGNNCEFIEIGNFTDFDGEVSNYGKTGLILVSTPQGIKFSLPYTLGVEIVAGTIPESYLYCEEQMCQLSVLPGEPRVEILTENGDTLVYLSLDYEDFSSGWSARYFILNE